MRQPELGGGLLDLRAQDAHLGAVLAGQRLAVLLLELRPLALPLAVLEAKVAVVEASEHVAGAHEVAGPGVRLGDVAGHGGDQRPLHPSFQAGPREIR